MSDDFEPAAFLRHTQDEVIKARGEKSFELPLDERSTAHGDERLHAPTHPRAEPTAKDYGLHHEGFLGLTSYEPFGACSSMCSSAIRRSETAPCGSDVVSSVRWSSFGSIATTTKAAFEPRCFATTCPMSSTNALAWNSLMFLPFALTALLDSRLSRT